MKDKKQFLKFIIVGVINTLFGTSIMFIAYSYFELGYWLSSALNYILGSILSYFLNKYFTFNKKELSISEICKFVINIVCCYFIAYLLAKTIVNIVLASYYSIIILEQIAMIFGMVLFVVLNFIGQKFLVFK